ncbi:hypothetical protein [Calothrix sp. UHCC 0171]|uniref:hypothetical protein n=1 Tax=Calothrix sp. UHCC 0171 TaxID=3110245 RepID=UPI002B2035B0|nr:hypothetical protein [Calothrix sp. UHCC 0171]MEA5571921.1 hypothetical protein [Calothrix sp. UHCC 0171]
MPFNTKPDNLAPIEVFEDETHFLVRIHPENRDRAKKIVGRQWDGDRKAWVYPKDVFTYEALAEEFQKDADKFDIQRPKTKRPDGIKPPLQEYNDEFEEEILEESHDKIHSDLDGIRVMLESLRDVASHQSRTLEELRETQKEARKTVQVLPDALDLTKQKEIELLENALVMIAYYTANKQKSFYDWMSKHAPLDRPRDFVSETHEFLKEQLGKITGDENPDTDFRSLIRKAENEDCFYSAKFDPIKPIPILNNLNAIRNRFHHTRGDFSQWEKWSRSILYLMNLALVWSKVVIEVDNFDV